jgi:AhpD family alkylhydroperoxidase
MRSGAAGPPCGPRRASLDASPPARAPARRVLAFSSHSADLVRLGDEPNEGGTMKPRIDFNRTGLQALKPLFALGAQVEASGLEPALLELLKLRASQINGCAFCIAWREAPLYTERERAALAWTEAVTLVADGHVPDEIYEQVRTQFTEQELVNLTLAVIAINGWNRLNVAFRTEAGNYQPGMFKQLLKTA